MSSHKTLTAEVGDAALESDGGPGGDLEPLAAGVQDRVIVPQLQLPLHVIIAIAILLIRVLSVIVIVIGGVLGESW